MNKPGHRQDGELVQQRNPHFHFSLAEHQPHRPRHTEPWAMINISSTSAANVFIYLVNQLKKKSQILNSYFSRHQLSLWWILFFSDVTTSNPVQSMYSFKKIFIEYTPCTRMGDTTVMAISLQSSKGDGGKQVLMNSTYLTPLCKAVLGRLKYMVKHNYLHCTVRKPTHKEVQKPRSHCWSMEVSRPEPCHLTS